ncbi:MULTISPECIES: class I SAM-dependent DNA methyltransferase [Aidingimonas]|uniref:Methyltransferase domain-containing protein n=1 Tax=Aidingimonas halophila TaxID=574349 RepID=A0A1H3A3V5_9GAMM|nr:MULTISPECIES: class I SAM-dependent methyltransferase [Aidingimonas]GHC21522.1 SAM-dependent methyltransferase [Aidingimonas halophila]SDX24293.1 Methyltransferase domain-containing protein [Aidingimonas halophila]
MTDKEITKTEILNKVYTADDHEQLRDAYKAWATDYDSDLAELGYVAHITSAEALDQALGGNHEAVILDAGSGTGLVGEELVKRGYRTLDALDYSWEMLDEAASKNIYRSLLQANMTMRLPLEDNAYDAVICTGTFTYGHITADGFDELVRVTRPGGVITFTVREGAYEEYGYRARMLDLEIKEAWELVSFYDTPYQIEEGNVCKMCTYRVLG